MYQNPVQLYILLLNLHEMYLDEEDVCVYYQEDFVDDDLRSSVDSEDFLEENFGDSEEESDDGRSEEWVQSEAEYEEFSEGEGLPIDLLLASDTDISDENLQIVGMLTEESPDDLLEAANTDIIPTSSVTSQLTPNDLITSSNGNSVGKIFYADLTPSVLPNYVDPSSLLGVLDPETDQFNGM